MQQGEPIVLNLAWLLGRIRNIIFKPQETFHQIADEDITTHALFMAYALPLAAIAPVALLISNMQTLIPMMVGLSVMAAYVIALMNLVIMAVLINLLSPLFGGKSDFNAAFKTATFALTAWWLAGIFKIMPNLPALGILGLYSLYLLYVGLPILMHIPDVKSLGFSIIIIILTIALSLVANGIIYSMTGTSRLLDMIASSPFFNPDGAI